MYFFVETYGAFVAKHQGRLRITKDKTRLDESAALASGPGAYQRE